MGWRKKEKPLTAEEAIALAKKELAPYWFGSEPLIAAVKGESQSRYTAYPLGSEFTKQAWLLVFLDLTTYTGETALLFGREWFKRYSSHTLGIIFIYRPKFQYLREYTSVSQFIAKRKIGFIVVQDHDGGMAAAFGARDLPKVILFDQAKPVFDHAGRDWLKGTEIAIQKFLRIRDPGLPMSPAIESLNEPVHDVGQINFASNALKYPGQGFVSANKGDPLAGKFNGETVQASDGVEFRISGAWQRDGERIFTVDPSASIGFVCPGTHLSVVAEAIPKMTEIGEIAVDLNGSPAYEAISAEGVQTDEAGRTIIRFNNEPHNHHLLRRIQEERKEITLRFPGANRCGVAIYGIRFAESI